MGTCSSFCNLLILGRAKERSEIANGIIGEYRKKYDEDFKKNAIKLSICKHKIMKDIADDLGIHEILLYNWWRK